MLRNYTKADLEDVGFHDPTVLAFLNIHKFRPEELSWEQMLLHMVVQLATEKATTLKRMIELANNTAPRYILCSQEALQAVNAKECPVVTGRITVPANVNLEAPSACGGTHGG